MNKKKIIAISGSARKNSMNKNYIRAMEKLSKDFLTFDIYEAIDTLPHFNPDRDIENTPEAVKEFRQRLRDADGILICTPEYAMGVPGTLKNAIDWTVSSMEFSKKPTVLITASSQGEKAHQSLLCTLRIIEAGISDEMHLLISYAKTKIDSEANITDADTLQKIKNVLFILNRSC